MIPRMDAVILAAGHNKRLKGLVPTAMKPLLVYNGQTLVGRLVQQALEVANAEKAVVVCSPLNAQPICEVLQGKSHIILQPSPTSPLDALRIGLQLCDSPLVMVLCGDNIVPDKTMNNVLGCIRDFDQPALTIALRTVEGQDARRFTRLVNARFEAPQEAVGQATSLCWIGPFVAPTEALRSILEGFGAETDQFADVFNELTATPPHRLHFAESDAADIGVPEEIA